MIHLFIIIIIMEICKAPTVRLKALNKHTHIMYTEMENVILKNKYYIYVYRQMFKHNYAKHAKHAHTHTHTHTHTGTVQNNTNRSKGQCGLTEIFWEEKCLELAFEGRERIIIIIKVFVKCKILYTETILSTHAHTHTHIYQFMWLLYLNIMPNEP